MIHDQANQLRQLARLQSHPRLAAEGSPEMIAVTGARHGVGTTTISVNLAMALALAGRRVILVDADLERGDVGRLCGITEPSSVIEVLSGRRNIHEVLVRGPVGVLIVPGVWAPASASDCSATSQQRLLNELRSLAVHADVVVIDTGSARNGFVRRFWQAADTPLVVTTPDPVSIMEGYATIKVLLSGIAGIQVRALINRAPTIERAEEVAERITAACRRFLGVTATTAPYVPEEPLALESAEAAMPLALASPHCEGARALERLAAALWPARRTNAGPGQTAGGSTSAA